MSCIVADVKLLLNLIIVLHFYFICSRRDRERTRASVNTRERERETVGITPWLFTFPPYRIRSDHNQDNTSAVLSEWAEGVKHLYRSLDLQISDEWLYDTEDPFEMPDERYEQIARLRQAGLEAARAANADYLMVLLLGIEY